MLGTQKKKRRTEKPPDTETGPPRKRRKKARNFDEMCQALLVFKQEHGNINVHSGYSKDTALGEWVKRIRSSQGTKLPPEQKAKLDQLGFDWEKKKEKDEKRWHAMLEKLKEYRRVHLNCCVPEGWSEDPQLSTWVKNQRQKEANNKLQPKRKQKLEAIKFQWRQRENKIVDTSVVDEKWLQYYQMLVAYRQENGDCLVTRKVKGGPDQALAIWVQRQRQSYQDGKLKEERKKWLDELSFVYKVDKTGPNSWHWDEMFEHLTDFKQEYGHVDVTKSYPKWGLGQWVDVQRRKGRKGTIDQCRAVRLQEIGVTWGKSLDERWEDGFAMLAEFQKKCGHCRVPDSYVSDGEVKARQLSNWVERQRNSQATGVLLQARKKRLDAIGFPWRGIISEGTGGTASPMSLQPVTRNSTKEKTEDTLALAISTTFPKKNDYAGDSAYSSDSEFAFEG